MMDACPEFEALSRFHDGFQDEAVGRHVSQCSRCAQTLAEMDGLDALLVRGLEASRPPLRIARFRWAAVAAVALLGVGLVLLQMNRAEEEPDWLSIQPAHTSLVWGQATRQGTDQKERTAAVNDAIAPGEVVLTRAGQRAKVNVADKAEVLINENSRVIMGSDVSLEQGEAYVLCTQPFQLQVAGSTTSLEPGEYRVMASPDTTVVSSIRGQATVDSTRVEPGRELRWNRKANKKSMAESRKNFEWTEPMRAVLFESSTLDGWRVEGKQGRVSAVDVSGKKAVSISSGPKRKGPMTGPAKPFMVMDGLEIEFDLRLATPGATAQMVVQAAPKNRIHCQWSSDHDSIGTHSSHAPAGDAWHHIKLVLTPTELKAFRDGQPDGSVSFAAVERAAFGWSVGPKEGSEVQISGLVIRRLESH
jgi:hypothetical protein